jgi:uncharacterized protein with von Willebrand factor type A (vWA) domain
MVMPPQQKALTLPRELILVIDTSGSMGGALIRQARAAVENPTGLMQLIDRDLGDSRLFPVGIGSAPGSSGPA